MESKWESNHPCGRLATPPARVSCLARRPQGQETQEKKAASAAVFLPIGLFCGRMLFIGRIRDNALSLDFLEISPVKISNNRPCLMLFDFTPERYRTITRPFGCFDRFCVNLSKALFYRGAAGAKPTGLLPCQFATDDSSKFRKALRAMRLLQTNTLAGIHACQRIQEATANPRDIEAEYRSSLGCAYAARQAPGGRV